MAPGKACLVFLGVLMLSCVAAHAQTPRQIVQQVVNTELAAEQTDQSQWVYLEETRKPNQQVLQWVATTRQADVSRVLRKNNQDLPKPQQRALIQKFLRDSKAQRRQVSELKQDNRQIDDLLRLLPAAFLWTQTGATATTDSLHFEPAPNFHSPVRAARIFSSMAGTLVVDTQQHRIRAMNGHLLHPVIFGGGILGRLKSGSFSLEQRQVSPGLWQLTTFDLDFEGNAFLFKSISLKQDDLRSNFERESPFITLDQAAAVIMRQPGAGKTQSVVEQVISADVAVQRTK